MGIPDSTSEKSIMSDIDYIEKVNEEIRELRDQLAKVKQQLNLATDLREYLQESISEHIGENKIDISKFKVHNQIRIERWLVDY